MTSWADQNDLLRFGKRILDTTGTPTPTEKSLISSLASATGVGYNVARNAYVKSVLDPLLQDKVHKSMKWIINSNFVPEFIDPKENGTGLDDDSFEEEIIDPAILSADGVPSPKRMFNLDTGNVEDWPSGQYVILSHSWKGQEITFSFLQEVRENARKREVYEMIRDSHDEDEDAKRFASFQVKKFGHLKAGKSDVELLAAQCKKDVDEHIKKIDNILSRSGKESDYSNAGTFLADFTEFKEATSETTSFRKELIPRRKGVEVKELADKNLDKEKQDMGVDDSETSIENEANITNSRNHSNKSLKIDSILPDLEDKMRLAEMRLENATRKYTILNKIPGLLSAIEDFLPILERRKSMYKIENSIGEAKRILRSGLFPSNGCKQYLWNDTICINKGDANEQNESLAMMGQWYNNADFCLVHLDTSSSTEWVSTWHSINMDSPGTWACDANFTKFEDVKSPKWSTRGWTLQELVLSKMAFWVNNLWEPLPRVVEGLGPYYYHCYYLQQHIREQDITNAPEETKSFLSSLGNLKSLMDTGEKIPYFNSTEDLEESRRIIGILSYLGVQFPGEMNDDNSGAYIRDTISRAAYNIESRINVETPAAESLPETIHNSWTLVDYCALAIEADRSKISGFTKVPPPECCRGLSRPTLPAHDTLSLASYRECTVPIDRVYSLVGVLGVKFSAFHAEGPTKALYRLLDEVVITTNDVSIFNWAGIDLGSPIRGRSLYPSSLNAFSPEKTENYFTSRNGELASASKENRYRLQDTASKITLILRRTIDFVKRTAHQDIPVGLLQTFLKFIEDISLKKLRPQLHHLGKLVVYLENTTTFEKCKPKIGYRTEKEKVQKALVREEEKPANQTNGTVASRFGFKTPRRPQIPQMPQISHISAPKRNIGLGGFSRKAKEPVAPMNETVDAPPVLHVEPEISAADSPTEEEPKSLIDEVNHWISQDQDINSIPKELQPLFDEIKAPKLNGPPMGKRQKPQGSQLLGSSMICPNPIMLTTSGIEAVFDIQRVIIEMQNPEHLRYQVQSAVNDGQKISGHCTISTALSMIKVNFTCEVGALKKQLDVCDVVQRALSDLEEKRTFGLLNSRPALTRGQESDSYYKKLTSLSSGLMGKVPESVDSTGEQNQNASTPDLAAQVQALGENSEQLRVVRMLDFVQENDINQIVGEWVLARFTGVEGAKWFLCQLELGSTHSYYGRRIATDKIDFENVVPEPGLVDHWESYMKNKKNELCRIVNVLVQGRVARQYADSVTSSEIKIEIDDDSDHEGADNKEKLKDFLFRRGTLIGAELVQTLTDIWGERLDAMLNDTILQQVPKRLRAAIMNLNENEDLLPAMFLSGIQVHMF
ncbi:uncharacterized protein Bfra_007561 [Botrytis fragariae]|uniref:Heterokaryon incompatibility domain-containing protein n=1 Tax=Botrytis fragariae TaxID=1964551 RepID=A0A8H6AJG4_9HELO|nr:uncharacterized protein Bfra_007561 [Botrytis fragariae]KAF5868363.1 hypothetical protein Bfra_007561 [Botrytis fragariae]